jgi:hypothetical protein
MGEVERLRDRFDDPVSLLGCKTCSLRRLELVV